MALSCGLANGDIKAQDVPCHGKILEDGFGVGFGIGSHLEGGSMRNIY